MLASTKKYLGERLIEKGLITREKLQEALKVQARSSEFLGQVLINMGAISEKDLAKVLDVDEAILKEDMNQELLKIIPEELIRKYKIFPIKKVGKKIYIAMSDPSNIFVIDDLRLITGAEIETFQAGENEINTRIEKYFRAQEVKKTLQDLVTELEFDKEETEEEEPEEQILDEAPIIRLVNSLIIKAIDDEASDIHIEPFEHYIRVRCRVDGILHEMMNLPRKMIHTIVSRIKVMGNMDIAERRVPQDGRIPLKLRGHNLDLRVSIMPKSFGEKVVIRILDKDNIKNYTTDSLGFSRDNLNKFNHFLNNPYGMILASGPTGSGKTTTLYTALNSLNSIDKNIVTIEDPIEYLVDGINQAQVNTKAGITFATYLRSILRQDPDIIMVGEIRDTETAEIAVRAATTGHLVLSTLHTNDAPGAVTRLIDMGIEPFMVASSVVGVVAQRLVRRVCQKCRQAYTPDKTEIAFAKIKPDSLLYFGTGCNNCNNTGYRGRMTIHEVLKISSPLKNLILKRASTEELRQVALREGMVPLKEDGVQKALQGLTTIKEIMRVAYREEDE